MIGHRTTGHKDATALMSVLLLTLCALAVIPALDADDGQYRDIYLDAGASFEYDDVPMVTGGYDIIHWELLGDLKDSFQYKDGKLTGTVPRNLSTGIYTLILESIGVKYHHGTPAETVTDTVFRFHVTGLNVSYQTGDTTDLPKILSMSITDVGNNGLYAMIKVVTENADRISFDYGDGISTEPSNLTSDTITFAHRYLQDGVYNVTVTVYNDAGSVQKVLVYNGQGYANEPVVPTGDDDNQKDLKFFWISLAATLVAALAALYTRHPYAIVAAAVLAVVTVALYIF